MTGDSNPTDAVEAVARAISDGLGQWCASTPDIDLSPSLRRQAAKSILGRSEFFAAIAAMPPAIGEQWRPIAEAPRDAERYLFVTKSGIQRVDRFHPEQFSNATHRWNEYPSDPYTHFRPLAAPPESVEPASPQTLASELNKDRTGRRESEVG